MLKKLSKQAFSGTVDHPDCLQGIQGVQDSLAGKTRVPVVGRREKKVKVETGWQERNQANCFRHGLQRQPHRRPHWTQTKVAARKGKRRKVRVEQEEKGQKKGKGGPKSALRLTAGQLEQRNRRNGGGDGRPYSHCPAAK
ncbi:hypothetical protein PVK06_042739 [Gossypium arboreum]|uniref:Uncharacterized protein n=1 Tax=Gossypium arboreum TaxID=29729 RepID=A0ABR0MLZ8_GOSAR|nr:hypothetical protein PVK06_042739 [Gossypium arboreum]